MAASSSRDSATKRCAIVTGANKGIGFEICKQLAAKGIMVVLTARDEKRGIEAVERLKDFGLSDHHHHHPHVVFHQLDVMDPTSVASLVGFIKSRFGKLDILINNAGILGVGGDVSAIKEKLMANASRVKSLGENEKEEIETKENAVYIENYELAEKCLQTNYYGAKRMTEAFIPLLQLSDFPRIVNVSSFWGMLKYVPNVWATNVLNDAENLTEERVDEVVNEFLKDFKESSLEAKSWPSSFPAYIISKAVLNAYTRIVANKYPNLCINCVCPGRVKTDMSCYTGLLTVEEGANGPVSVALLPNGGPSGVFFVHQAISSF